MLRGPLALLAAFASALAGLILRHDDLDLILPFFGFLHYYINFSTVREICCKRRNYPNCRPRLAGPATGPVRTTRVF